MSPELAKAILIALAATGLVVWLIGLWFLVGSYRRGTTAAECPADHFGQFEQFPKDWLLGSIEVDGQPANLVAKAASFVARQGTVTILERTNDRLVFERGALALAGLPERGQARFISLGTGRSRIDYAIQVSACRWLLFLGGLFQAFGLAALTVGGWVIYVFCVQSPDPQIRVQTIQMVQVVHFLWPPFLCGALYRRWKRVPRESIESLLRNLPYLDG